MCQTNKDAPTENDEVAKTSYNNAMDVICGDNVCEYCQRYGKCFGTQHFPVCFRGRKLTPIA